MSQEYAVPEVLTGIGKSTTIIPPAAIEAAEMEGSAVMLEYAAPEAVAHMTMPELKVAPAPGVPSVKMKRARPNPAADSEVVLNTPGWGDPALALVPENNCRVSW
jgi:hypothetical protein